MVIEAGAMKQLHEYKVDTLTSPLDVACPCGAYIHAIAGAWCPLCGAKVVEIRHVG